MPSRNDKRKNVTKKSNTIEPTDENVLRFGHKYKWTLQEKLILAFLNVGMVAMIIFGFMQDMDLGLFLIAGGFLIAIVSCIWLGAIRKKKSEVFVNYDKRTDQLDVSGHTFEPLKNKVTMQKINRINVRQIGANAEMGYSPRDLIVVGAGDENNSRILKFPLRALANKGFAELMNPYFEKYADKDTLDAYAFGTSYKG